MFSLIERATCLWQNFVEIVFVEAVCEGAMLWWNENVMTTRCLATSCVIVVVVFQHQSSFVRHWNRYNRVVCDVCSGVFVRTSSSFLLAADKVGQTLHRHVSSFTSMTCVQFFLGRTLAKLVMSMLCWKLFESVRLLTLLHLSRCACVWNPPYLPFHPPAPSQCRSNFNNLSLFLLPLLFNVECLFKARRPHLIVTVRLRHSKGHRSAVKWQIAHFFCLFSHFKTRRPRLNKTSQQRRVFFSSFPF